MQQATATHRSKYRYSTSIYPILLYRIFLVYLFYSLSRLFFYAYNADLLEVESGSALWRMFLGGLRFDTSAICYVNLLVIFLHILPLKIRYRQGYQLVLSWVYWVCNILAFIPNLADIVYYRFTFHRTSMQVFDEFSNENSLRFLSFLWTYWPVTLTGLGFIALWVWLYKQVKLQTTPPKISNKLYYTGSILAFITVVFFTLSGIRGVWRIKAMRPINASNATIYIDRPQQRALVLNTPFVMIRTLGKTGLKEVHYFDEDKAQTLFSAYRTPTQDSPYKGKYKGRNVVVIIWESFAREWVGSLNKDIPGYKGYTPFIDSLLQHSYYFERAYSGGGQSIDAMPSILASILKPVVPFISSPYSGNVLSSLPDELKQNGYTTAFFHNAPNGSMGFDAFTKQIGFEHYYGMKEYGNDADFDGAWGIWDEEFLQYVAHTIGTLPQPFLATEFTTSSHYPFKIPQRYKSKFPQGPLPLQQCIAYTDYSLRRFFETARQQSWYDNTIFIITADHAVPGDLQKYKTSVGVFRIPIIIFDPKEELKGKDSTTVVQQADILPTVMDLVGVDRPTISFGHNMLSPSSEHYAVTMVDGVYQLIWGDYVLIYDGSKILGLYNLVTDPEEKTDIQGSSPEILSRMLPKLQAIIQELAHRMVHNQLRIDSPRPKQ